VKCCFFLTGISTLCPHIVILPARASPVRLEKKTWPKILFILFVAREKQSSIHIYLMLLFSVTVVRLDACIYAEFPWQSLGLDACIYASAWAVDPYISLCIWYTTVQCYPQGQLDSKVQFIHDPSIVSVRAVSTMHMHMHLLASIYGLFSILREIFLKEYIF